MENIALLLSGGVDSAVALHMLREQGHRPTLFYILIGPEEKEAWNCSSEEDWEVCQWLARKYDCKLEQIDLHHEYWDQVVKYTMDKERRGLTPNPDVMCNKLIKFGCFEEKIGHEFDFTATGHYAQTAIHNGKVWLATSPDPVKDQTDFLCQLNYQQVSKSMFPIGSLHKEEVREIAVKNNLINANRKDSQGVCFLGQIDFREYVRRFLGEHPGRVIDIDSRKIIGEHKGLWFHTIGQRKGLGFGGGPWFVVKKDVKNNILWVSHGYSPKDAYSTEWYMEDFHFITENPWGEDGGEHRITFKIRHTPEYNPGTISMREDGTWGIKSDEPIHGVAPGQFCVVYDEEHRLCIGSGEIRIF